MEFKSFKIMYAETMMHYQRIERDIKIIYSFMLNGDVNENFWNVEYQTLGNMIKKLKELDESDDCPYINPQDYNFLIQICDNRNHWAHNVFAEFIYEENFENGKSYKKQCKKLIKDYNRVEKAANILEKIRFEYCHNSNNN